MGFMDKVKEFAKGHSEQASQGVDKAGDAAKEKFGHEEQVDTATGKAKEYLGGDSGQPGGEGGPPGGDGGQPGGEGGQPGGQAGPGQQQ